MEPGEHKRKRGSSAAKSAKERETEVIVSKFMSVTAKKIAASETYKPRPEGIPIPFTGEELRYVESVERGCRRTSKAESHELETEEERQISAYMELESNSFFLFFMT